ncbi:MAG: aspartate aminotransferase family protein [Halioglobus sp.]
MSALMDTYARLPITFTHGEGVYLVDTDGRRYLDAIAGIGVNALGHAHPAVTAAITEQAGKLIHTSNLYHVANQEKLAERLTAASGMSRCFFGNSGAEANEAAIKLARLYGHSRGVKKPTIVVLENAFHGRTLATLTATGNRKIQAGFEPLVAGFTRAPLNDLDAIKHIAANNTDVVAVLIEPIQGEGGVNPASSEYLKGLRTLCDEHEWLLMFDEVQTGNGRTGTYFAYQDEGFAPDVVTTAKGLGNGMPIGACLARGKAAEVFSAGNHGSTYGGNPLACATSLAVVNTIIDEDLPANARAMGQLIRDEVIRAVNEPSAIADIRGKGLMIGIELNRDCPELVSKALDHGLLINVTAGNTIRLLPPLIINKEQALTLARGVAALIDSLDPT